MSRRIRVHRSGSLWFACRVEEDDRCVTILVGPCDSHAEVIERLDAMRPTLEPCS